MNELKNGKEDGTWMYAGCCEPNLSTYRNGKLHGKLVDTHLEHQNLKQDIYFQILRTSKSCMFIEKRYGEEVSRLSAKRYHVNGTEI